MLFGMIPQGFQDKLESIEQALIARALRALAVLLAYLSLLVVATASVAQFVGLFAAMMTLGGILAITAVVIFVGAERVAPKPAPKLVVTDVRGTTPGGVDAMGDRVSAGLALLLGAAVVVGPLRLMGTAIRAYSLYTTLRSVSRGRDLFRI